MQLKVLRSLALVVTAVAVALAASIWLRPEVVAVDGSIDPAAETARRALLALVGALLTGTIAWRLRGDGPAFGWTAFACALLVADCLTAVGAGRGIWVGAWADVAFPGELRRDTGLLLEAVAFVTLVVSIVRETAEAPRARTERPRLVTPRRWIGTAIPSRF